VVILSEVNLMIILNLKEQKNNNFAQIKDTE